jgi:hypothetical protein
LEFSISPIFYSFTVAAFLTYKFLQFHGTQIKQDNSPLKTACLW